MYHQSVKFLRNGSFFVISPQLYNSISASLRELENDNEVEKQKVENSKKKMDEYLRTIPVGTIHSWNNTCSRNIPKLTSETKVI